MKRRMSGRSSWLLPFAAGTMLLVSAAASILPPRLPFANPELHAGCRPGDLVAADFNNDGMMDLAVANQHVGAFGCPPRGGIDVLLGSGGGIFTRSFHLERDSIAPDLVSADFNADGNVDLAMVYTYNDGVLVLSGRGDGTFLDPVWYDAGVQPIALTAADFNSDGRQDIAVASEYSRDFGLYQSDIAVLISIPGGGFAPPVFMQTRPRVSSIVSGDLDHDGFADLALTNILSYGSEDLWESTLLSGRGDGTFSLLRRTFADLGNARYIDIVDFNTDLKLDLVMLIQTGTIDRVDIEFGNGDGTFSGGTGVLSPRGTAGAGIGDLNGDGKPDLALTTFLGEKILAYINRGDETLDAPLESEGGGGRLVIADLSADGKADIAAAGPGKISIRLGSGDGTFGTPLRRVEGEFSTTAFAVGDFNRDGRSDFAMNVACELGPYGPIMGVAIWLSEANGTVRSPECHASEGAPRQILRGDLNGDSADDLLVLGAFGVLTLLGRGDGTFHQGSSSMLLFSPRAAATGDLNADGVPDLVLVDVCPGGRCPSESNPNVPGRVHVHLGSGDGSFSPRFSADVGPLPTSAAIGDLNGDGLADVAVPSGSDPRSFNCWYCPVAVLLGNGDGTLQQRVFFEAGRDAVGIAVGRFNADPFEDVAVVNATSADVTVLLGDKDSILVPQGVLEVGALPQAISVLDADVDGFTDILTANRGSRNLSVLRGTGDGGFGEPMLFLAETFPLRAPSAISSGDFDGDGRPDFVILNTDFTFGSSSSASLTLLLNQSMNENQAPLANAGADHQVECSAPPSLPTDPPQPGGTPVTLDGSASSDADSSSGTNDDIAAFDWFVDFGLPTVKSLGSGEQITVGLPLGTHHVTLRVTDSQGATDTDELTIAVVDTTPPSLTCPAPLNLECEGPLGTFVTLSPSVSDTCSPSLQVRFESNPFPTVRTSCSPIPRYSFCAAYPPGTASVTITAADLSGNASSCSTSVTVADTIPPDLALTLTESNLWPPNHRVVPVQASLAASDVCTPAPQVALASIASSEPDDAPGSGDGSTKDDIQGVEPGTADFDFSLRAERDGNGPGRTYTVTYAATDASGNSTTRSATVFVPHDQGGVVEPVLIRAAETVSGTLLRWCEAPGALAYSVVRGGVRSLRQTDSIIDLGETLCIEASSVDPTTFGSEDVESPQPGEAFFYVVDFHAGWSSTFGTEAAPKPRQSSAGGCLGTAAGSAGERRRL